MHGVRIGHLVIRHIRLAQSREIGYDLGMNEAEMQRKAEIDREHRRGLKQYIYLAHAATTNMYKLGKTTNPKTRIDSLNTVCPYKVEYVYVVSVSDFTGSERIIHDKLKTYQANGEWYSLSAEWVKKVVATMDGMGKCWEGLPKVTFEK